MFSDGQRMEKDRLARKFKYLFRYRFYVVSFFPLSVAFLSSMTMLWDLSKCLFSPRLLNNSFPHWWHLNLIPSCTFLVCRCKFSMYRKASLHILHWWSFSPKWTAETKTKVFFEKSLKVSSMSEFFWYFLTPLHPLSEVYLLTLIN